MNKQTNLEIECHSSLPEDKLFLALCCGQKQIAAKEVITEHQALSLKWADINVIGPAAVCLCLEALAPTPSLFPNGNMGMPLALLHWWQSMKKKPISLEAALAANSLLVSRQMADGRPFLQGLLPGLADVCAASWCIPHRNIFVNDATLSSWIERMHAIATGPQRQNLVTLTPFADFHENIQHIGLLDFSTEDGTTTITSPLD